MKKDNYIEKPIFPKIFFRNNSYSYMLRLRYVGRYVYVKIETNPKFRKINNIKERILTLKIPYKKLRIVSNNILNPVYKCNYNPNSSEIFIYNIPPTFLNGKEKKRWQVGEESS